MAFVTPRLSNADSESCHSQSSHLSKSRMLPRHLSKVLKDLEFATDPDYTRLPLSTGTFRIYCDVDGRLLPLGVNSGYDSDSDSGSGNRLVVLEENSRLLAKFRFEDAIESFRVYLYIDGDPVVPDYNHNHVKCSVGGFAYDWIAVLPKDGHWTWHSLCTNILDSGRQIKLDWDVSKPNSAGRRCIVLTPTRSQALKLYLKPSDFPLTSGAYTIYSVGKDRKLRALSIDWKGTLVALRSDAQPSEYGRFTFTLHSENDQGTFIHIYVDEQPVVPWKKDKIKSSADVEPYAWQVMRKETDIYSIFTDTNVDYDGYDSGTWRIWSRRRFSDDEMKLCLRDAQCFFTPSLFFLQRAQ